MLGINISTRGNYKKHNGKKYYFLETTYPGWSIGDLPPDFKNKRFWFISEIDKGNNKGSFNFKRNNSNRKSKSKVKPSPAEQ